jgi:SYP5 family syntaxin
MEKSTMSASDKDALLGSSSSGRAGAAGYQADAAAAAAARDPEQLMQRTQQEIKNQDELLDTMSKGLDNLKNVGLAIRDETDLHMKLLDELEDGVDQGNANLKRETARAEHITRDTKTCWLYITICVLLGVLVALVVARWH